MAEDAPKTVKGEATKAEVGHTAPEHAPGFPPFASETFASQLFWFALLFGALYLLMSRIALPRVGAIIKDRRDKIARDLDEAAAMQKQADEANARHEKTIADAKAKALATAQAEREKVTAQADARRKAVEDDLAAKLVLKEKDIAAMKTSAMNNVHAIAHEAAAHIIQHITGKPAPADALARAIAAARQA